MNALTETLLMLLAPLPFCIVGYALWAQFKLSSEKRWLVPLIGCAAFGWFAEVGFVAGVGVRTTLYPLLFVSLLLTVHYRKQLLFLRPMISEFYLYYVVLLTAILINPYPGLGHMSGDWLEHYSMSQAIWTLHFPENLLARPPFYAAASTGLYLFHYSLGAFQVFSAVVSAGALLTFRYASEKLKTPTLSFIWLAIFLFMPHTLVHTLAYWPKFFAASLLFVSAIEAVHYRNNPVTLKWSGLFFGLALAVHHTSVFYAPLLVILTFGKTKKHFLEITRQVGLIALLVLMTAGIFELWVASQYGLLARINMNPVMHERPQVGWLPLKVFVSNFSGDNILINLAWKFSLIPGGASTTKLLAQGYYLISSWVIWLVCSLPGIFLPFLLTSPRKLLSILRALRTHVLFFPATLGAFIVITGTSVIQPQMTPFGAIQCGVGGVIFLAYWAIATACTQHRLLSFSQMRKIAVTNFCLGTVPFALSQLPLLFVLEQHSAWSEKIWTLLQGLDVDAKWVAQNNFAPLAQVVYPYGLLIALAGLIFVFYQRQTEV